ncbi:cell surface protein SprA [bacterium]|nr:cell surface protein SprA [bacterium]
MVKHSDKTRIWGYILIISSLLLGLFIFEAGAYSGLEMSLEERGRYFLPLESTYPLPLFNLTTNQTALLNWDKLNVRRIVVVNFTEGFVMITETVDGHILYQPRIVPLDEYIDLMTELGWIHRSLLVKDVLRGEKAGGIVFEIPVDFPDAFRSIIGEGGASLQVHGRRKITFSGRSEWREGDIATGGHTVSKWPSLNMEQESQFNITGTIGSRIGVKVDQDSDRMTELENTINIQYTGTEDDVVQLIEAGNTTLALSGASYAGYSEKVQGLFGIKSKLQIGDWQITAVASQEKSEHKSATFHAGASSNEFEIHDYDFMKRTYFFVDDQYRYFTYAPGDSIIKFKLYKMNNANQLTTLPGVAYVDPANPTFYPLEGEAGRFEEISKSDYELSRLQGYLRLNRSIADNDILACAFVIQHSDGSIDSVGTVIPEDYSGTDTLRLNLIKDEDSSPSNHTWEYEWRNVYKLPGEDLDIDGLELLIYLGDVNEENTDDYLRLFGLDQINMSGDASPDGLVDPIYINAADGELIFPVLHPFAPTPEDIALLPDLATLTDTVPSIYKSNNQNDQIAESRFTLKGKVKSRQLSTSLGNVNIIEGSETVTLNGERLSRGTDYQIDYMTGQISFLSDEAKDPNARIKVDYEYEPFFQPEQKTLLGTRVEYRFSDNSWIGTTALYKSASASAKRPRLGGEPSRTFIWDADLALNFEPEIFTRMADALPLISTDQESRLEIKGEVAQVFSNPNIKGEAYLDDFEGSRNEVSLGIRRTTWTIASPPFGYNHEDRGRLWWYNPYDRVKVADIWPEKEVSSEDSKVNVLALAFEDTAMSGNAWAGVMRYMPQGYQDQGRAQFIEIWVKGDEGILHIDLGETSEDVDGNDLLDTEDKLRNGIRDGVLQEDEDVGLDGISNTNETTILAGGTANDPHGDNWDYDSDNPYDYSRINGTENNHLDPEGGKRPDTEDLNGNNGLDKDDNYFEYIVDLSSNLFEVPGTRNPETGWRLYRIPFQNAILDTIEDARPWVIIERGDPDSSDIEYARIWISGVDSATTIYIATLDIVGNDWETRSEHYQIFVKSTHENQDYSPPPGISAERDPQTGLRYAEQSLSIKYKKFPPTDSTEAPHIYNILREKEDFTYYEKLKMFVYWNDSLSDTTRPYFFFRMGRDENNFYEYSCRLEPGWDTLQNSVEIDFPVITAFKNTLLEDSTVSDSTIPYKNGYYRVKGNPSLTYIKAYYIGIYNPNPVDSISGEIWLDELRLTDVRRSPGWAQKGEVNMSFADLLRINTSIERKDSEFHSLRESKGSGETNTIKRLNTSLNGHKFFPVNLNVTFPINYNYTHNISNPRLKTGSDIVLPSDLREQERTLTEQHSMNTSFQIQPDTDNFLVNMTISRMKHNLSYGRNYGFSPTQPLNVNSNYQVSQIYDLTPKGEYKIPLAWWADDSSSSTLKGIELNYAPTKLLFNTSISSTRRLQRNKSLNETSSFTRDLEHSTSFNTKPFNALTTTFLLNLKRDLKEGDDVELGFKGIRLGIPLSKRINNGITFSPSFLSFLTQSYSFTSNYTENTNPSQVNQEGVYGSAQLAQKISINLILNLTKLVGEAPRGGREAGGETPGGGALVNLLRKLKPIKASYDRDNKTSYPGLTAAPSWLYQLGFTENPGVTNQTLQGATQRRVSKTLSNTLKANTGATLWWETNADLAFNWRTQSNAVDNTKTTSLVFPDIGLRSNKLRDLGFFKKATRSTNLTSGYRYTVDKNFDEGTMTTVTWKRELAPLVSLDITWNIGVQTKLSSNYAIQLTDRATSTNLEQKTTQSIDLQISYAFRATKGINIPLIKKTISFENNLNLSLTISKSKDLDEYGPDKESFIPRSKTDTFKILPKASYNFSRNIHGGIDIEYTNRDTMHQKTRIRGVSVWAEIRF